MREVDITLTSGETISGIITQSGDIWSPLGKQINHDEITDVRPADTNGYDEHALGGHWPS